MSDVFSEVDWASVGLVLVVGLVASVAVVTVYATGLRLLASGSDERPNPAARLGGWLCVAVSAAIVLYGVYLIVPQFH